MFSISLNISLSQSEVENENFIGSFVQPNTEVVGFDISVNKVPIMHVLNSSNHLINQHQNSFQGEFSECLIKKRFEGRPH